MIDSDLEQRAVRHAGLRLLPFLFLLYVFNFLDRTNISIAALHMNDELKFDPAVFGFGAGIFFAGYSLFEVPSNLILARVGARRWIARIMITWGVLATSMVWVRTPGQFYVVRLLLGVAEAGFYPGVLYYLTQWFPAAHRARATARFAIAIPLSQSIGGALGGTLLRLGGVGHLSGWQWLFVLEGLPSVLLGFIALAYLTDRPADALWLPAEERRCLIDRLAAERDRSIALRPTRPIGALTNCLTWVLAMTYFAYYTLNVAYIFWAPQLIRDALKTGDLATGLVAAAIALLAAVAFLVGAARSDRSDERCGFAALGLGLSAAGCLGAAIAPTPLLRVVALALIPIGSAVFVPAFWCLPAMLFTGTAAAAAIALISAVGSSGGFFG